MKVLELQFTATLRVPVTAVANKTTCEHCDRLALPTKDPELDTVWAGIQYRFTIESFECNMLSPIMGANPASQSKNAQDRSAFYSSHAEYFLLS